MNQQVESEAVKGAIEKTVATFDEVAPLVAFIAGPESSYITGANLTVDGGMNA